MKKILLGLGTFAAVAAPIAGVVSCGTASLTKLRTIFDEAKDDDAKVKALEKFYDTTEGATGLFDEDKFTQKGNFTNVNTIVQKFDKESEKNPLTVLDDISAVSYEVDEGKVKVIFMGKEDGTGGVTPTEAGTTGTELKATTNLLGATAALATGLFEVKAGSNVAKIVAKINANKGKVSHLLFAIEQQGVKPAPNNKTGLWLVKLGTVIKGSADDSTDNIFAATGSLTAEITLVEASS